MLGMLNLVNCIVGADVEENKKGAISYQAKAMYWHEQRIRECQQVSLRSWQALIAAFCLIALMATILLYSLLHDKAFVVVVHHRADGSVWLTQLDRHTLLPSQEETEGNLVHYVQSRESYSASSYEYQYTYVKNASSPFVYHGYAKKGSYRSKGSMLREDGDSHVRDVLIHDVMFMPKIHRNKKESLRQDPIADISYRVCRHSLIDGSSTCIEKHALLAWHYRGMPSDPRVRWMNWRGFTVSYFQTIKLGRKQSAFGVIGKNKFIKGDQ